MWRWRVNGCYVRVDELVEQVLQKFLAAAFVHRFATGVSSIAGGAVVGHPVCSAVRRQRVDALHGEITADAAGRPAAAGKVGGIDCVAIGILQRQGLAGVV